MAVWQSSWIWQGMDAREGGLVALNRLSLALRRRDRRDSGRGMAATSADVRAQGGIGQTGGHDGEVLADTCGSSAWHGGTSQGCSARTGGHGSTSACVYSGAAAATRGGAWRARAMSRHSFAFRHNHFSLGYFDHAFLPIFELKCTKEEKANLLVSLPSTTFTKAHRCFSQHILHKLMQNFECHSILMDRSCCS
jgi:hypothetical protein